MKDVPLNEIGRRIGESHHRSTISDAIVSDIRDLHEIKHKSYAWIARRYRIPKCTIAKICRYERRAHRPERWRRVDDNGNLIKVPKDRDLASYNDPIEEYTVVVPEYNRAFRDFLSGKTSSRVL